MSRRTVAWAAALGLPILLLVWWIASNTYWADARIPLPPRGEAATNP